MAKRNRTNGALGDHQPKKKSKTERRAKDSEKTAATHEASTPEDGSSVIPAVSESELEKFFAENSIKITDPLAEASAPRAIISFSHLPPCDNNDLYAPLSPFPSPTPIQSATWPLLFSGRDLIGIAETGSGKTLAFTLPCLRKILGAKKREKKPYRPTAVIIAPTRELAMQTRDQLVKFAGPVNVEVACVFGGVGKEEQRAALKTAAIVIATPGRLKDLQNDGSVVLKKVKYLVLDEADRMLDKGFEQDVKDIITPMSTSRRQTVMFTATWPRSVKDLAASFMTSPVTVTVGGDPSADPKANVRIKQSVEVVNPKQKEPQLLRLLERSQRNPSFSKILVFCLYKKEAARIENLIRQHRFAVAGIHGDMNQQQRFKSLEAFKSGAATILVATDVAARGLDIPSVTLVVNYTFPLTVEDYVHRIGR